MAERRMQRMKNRRIGLRVTEDEEQKIKAKVPNGMTLSRFVVEAATKRMVGPPDRKLHHELRRIGVSLSEIARRVSEGWVVNSTGIREELARIGDELERLG
jgi:hypothetical protein